MPRKLADRVSDETLDTMSLLVGGLDDCTQYEGKDGYALVDQATYDAVLAENRRLRKQVQNSLANNLCSDHRDKQMGKPCLACEIERLESLLSRWLDWLKRSGPEGSNQWEKFDAVRRDTEAALDPDYMTAEEAELYRQAESLPVYDGPADPVPFRER